jgi:hypothetical protein
MLPLVQVLFTALILAYAGYWRTHHSKRRSESWDEIVAKLRPNDWGYEDVTERYLYSDQITATPEDVWDRISGARGLWAMYCNASVLVRLADYAAEHGNGQGVPEELLESIRTDAFHTRICVLMALAQHVFSRRSSIAARVSAHRATETYSTLLRRMTSVFQEHTAILFPRFLDAM